MKNDELKAEANQLIQRAALPELLSSYSRWFIGGSYSYDLMCWRDLDIYVLDPQHDLQRCFKIGFELTRRLVAKKARFTDNVSSPPRIDEPRGLYWGIKLGDEREGAWKLDVWFLDLAEYEQHENYSAGMRGRLTPDTRTTICEIKEEYWRRPEYRDTITGNMIYRAVMDNGVRTVADFQRFVRTAQAHMT
jgi:hypothetical protein